MISQGPLGLKDLGAAGFFAADRGCLATGVVLVALDVVTSLETRTALIAEVGLALARHCD